MTKLDELQKAIEEVAEAGTGMLRKSQMSLDFSAPNPHHVAYTRTNASGTVSNIEAKGSPHPKQAEIDKYLKEAEYHDAMAKEHESHGNHPNPISARYSRDAMRQSQSIARVLRDKAEKLQAASGTVSNVQAKGAAKVQKVFSQADKNGKLTYHEWETAKEIPNYEGEYTSYHAGTGSQMHTWIDKYGERNHSPMTKDQYNEKYGEDFGSDAHRKLLDGVHKVGNDLLNNPMLAEHHDNIRRKLEGLKANPTSKAAAQVAGDLKLIAEKHSLKKHPMYTDSDYNHLKGKGYDDTEIKNIWDRDQKSGNDPLVHKKAPDVTGVVGNPDFYRPKAGDTVHMGLAVKGGAGFVGKVEKIDGEMVHIKNDEGRTFKGHISKVSKP